MSIESLSEWVIGSIAAGLVGIISWVVRQMRSDIANNRSQIADHKLEVAKNYATKNDLDRLMHGLEAHFSRIDSQFEKTNLHIEKIMDKLDTKADK